MTDLKIISLGVDGFDYVKACLRQGTGLCDKILRCTLTDGETFAPVPEGTSLARAKSFSAGGLISRRTSLAWFAIYIKNLRKIEENGTLIFQDIGQNRVTQQHKTLM
jgi:hypothetical protein